MSFKCRRANRTRKAGCGDRGAYIYQSWCRNRRWSKEELTRSDGETEGVRSDVAVPREARQEIFLRNIKTIRLHDKLLTLQPGRPKAGRDR